MTGCLVARINKYVRKHPRCDLKTLDLPAIEPVSFYVMDRSYLDFSGLFAMNRPAFHERSAIRCSSSAPF